MSGMARSRYRMQLCIYVPNGHQENLDWASPTCAYAVHYPDG